MTTKIKIKIPFKKTTTNHSDSTIKQSSNNESIQHVDTPTYKFCIFFFFLFIFLFYLYFSELSSFTYTSFDTLDIVFLFFSFSFSLHNSTCTKYNNTKQDIQLLTVLFILNFGSIIKEIRQNGVNRLSCVICNLKILSREIIAK